MTLAQMGILLAAGIFAGAMLGYWFGAMQTLRQVNRSIKPLAERMQRLAENATRRMPAE